MKVWSYGSKNEQTVFFVLFCFVCCLSTCLVFPWEVDMKDTGSSAGQGDSVYKKCSCT